MTARSRSGTTARKQGAKSLCRLVKATSIAALDRIELDPGIGSPVLGQVLGIPSLRTWKMSKFPLLWIYFVRDDHLDVVRLLGERQDVDAILASAFEAD